MFSKNESFPKIFADVKFEIPKMIEFELCFYYGLRGANNVWTITPPVRAFLFWKTGKFS